MLETRVCRSQRRPLRVVVLCGVVLAMVLLVNQAVSVSAEEAVAETVIFDDLLNRPQIEMDDAQRMCGRYAMFLWLQITGHAVDYASVERGVPVGESGTSLEQMELASQEWASGMKAVSATAAALKRLDSPTIAHIWIDTEAGRQGHYLVLIRVEDERVYLADGANLVADWVPLQRFLQMWSGFLLVPQKPVLNQVGEYFVMISMVCIGMIAISMATRSVRRHARFVRKLTWANVGVALVCPFLLGCGGDVKGVNSLLDAKPVESDRRDTVLRVTRDQADMGTIALGDKAITEFELANVSDRSLTLVLGYPTCNCLEAKLEKDILFPGEVTSLRMHLGAAGHQSGPRAASVTLSAIDTEDTTSSKPPVWRFLVSGMLEGMKIQSYTLRYPANGRLPEAAPLRCAIFAEPTAKPEAVRILETYIDDNDTGLEFGKPVMDEPELRPNMVRFGAEIPIQLDATIPPRTGRHHVTIVYEIDGKRGTASGVFNVIPSQVKNETGEKDASSAAE